eukprot:4748502-Lingulodinium_polyedra.AAC.1
MELSGVHALKHVSTLFLPEVQETSPQGRPACSGKAVERPWCRRNCPPTIDEVVRDLNVHACSRRSSAQA